MFVNIFVLSPGKDILDLLLQNFFVSLNFFFVLGVTQMSLLQHQLKAMDEATKIKTNMEVGIGKRKHLCKRIALFKAGNILTD